MTDNQFKFLAFAFWIFKWTWEYFPHEWSNKSVVVSLFQTEKLKKISYKTLLTTVPQRHFVARREEDTFTTLSPELVGSPAKTHTAVKCLLLQM